MKKRRYLIGLVALVAVVIAGTVGVVMAANPPTNTTRISNVLTANVQSQAEANSLAMTWALGVTENTEPATYVLTDLDLTMTVGTARYLWVKTLNTKSYAIDKVLFLVETAADNFDIMYWDSTTSTWLGPLSYGTSYADCYYYGPVTGFPMPGGYTATTEFKITANAAGAFTAEGYAVQRD